MFRFPPPSAKIETYLTDQWCDCVIQTLLLTCSRGQPWPRCCCIGESRLVASSTTSPPLCELLLEQVQCFLPDSRCWVSTISSCSHCAGRGQSRRPFSRKVASLTPTLPLRPQTFVSSSLSCLVFLFLFLFFLLSPEGQSWRVYNQRAVRLLNSQTWSVLNARWGEARRGEATLLLWSALSHVRVQTLLQPLANVWVCVTERERERETKVLCASPLLKGEMRCV